MNNKFSSLPVRSSEITPKQAYLSRRDFIKAAGVVAREIGLLGCDFRRGNRDGFVRIVHAGLRNKGKVMGLSIVAVCF